MIGSFVLVSSFLYGVSRGLTKEQSQALAAVKSDRLWQGPVRSIELRHLVPPRDVFLSPVGEDILLNNHAAEMVSFVSNRDAVRLLEEQAQRWRKDGLKAILTNGDHRGFVLATNSTSSERYMFSCWTVPEIVRERVSGGYPTMGTMTMMENSPSDPSAAEGIDDVPVRPGGQAGAIFSAKDPAGRTYSTVYTVPEGVRENMAYYRTELEVRGWHEVNTFAGVPNPVNYEVGNMIFRREGEELVLLFTPAIKEVDRDGNNTVISVTKGPLNIERWKALP